MASPVSPGDPEVAILAPHCEQNLASLGFSCPHWVQNGIGSASRR
nr:hypothetical protein [Phytoactinopolyspora alkaliphila]